MKQGMLSRSSQSFDWNDDALGRILLDEAIYGNFGNVVSMRIYSKDEWNATRQWFAFRKAGYTPTEIVEYFQQYDYNNYWYEAVDDENLVERESHLCKG